MSRSTRDLRELICMSRLSYHEDDDSMNSFLDANDVDNELGRKAVPKETITTVQSASQKYPKTKGLPIVSPPVSPESSGRGSPLPPIRKSKSASSESSSSGCSSRCSPTGAASPLDKTSLKRPLKPITDIEGVDPSKPVNMDLDSLLLFFDTTVISDWLSRSNQTVDSLTFWVHSGNNFVNFANFWLTELSPSKRWELISMEFSIVMDELKFAFGVGIQDKKLKIQEVSAFMSSVLWEYPQKFASTRGGAFFLNLVMCLCCGRKENYKTLLSDVRCSTSNKQFVQLVLATRAFALVSLCSGVIAFYKEIHLQKSPSDVGVVSLDRNIHLFATDFAFQAIQKGLVKVFQYFLLNYKLKAITETTEDGKCFLFAAILSGQEEILRLLLKFHPNLDVNRRSVSSGNTPLHAAVNAGNTSIVRILVEAGAHVNSWNGECEGAAPLHWAVISGNKEMVSLLLSLGCDPSVKMGVPASVTPLDLARDLGLDEVVTLLKEVVKISE